MHLGGDLHRHFIFYAYLTLVVNGGGWLALPWEGLTVPLDRPARP
jgi:hypothetical protein